MAKGNVLPKHLLLLPPPPSSFTSDALGAAYRVPVTATLKEIAASARKATTGASLDIALSAPFLIRPQDRPALYDSVQSLLAGLYRLIGVVATENGLNIEDKEGIDARIVFLDDQNEPDEQTRASLGGYRWGPIVDLKTLASSGRQWQRVFAIDSEDGTAVLNRFLTTRDTHTYISRVTGGESETEGTPTTNDASPKQRQYEKHVAVIVGGTWDHLHLGHKLLLTLTAFLIDDSEYSRESERTLTVGISGDQILQKKEHRELLETLDERQTSVLAFLRAIMDFRPPKDATINTRDVSGSTRATNVDLGGVTVKFSELFDIYGPTITDEALTALVVSAETRSGGQAVNKERTGKEWHELDVFEVEVLAAKGEDDEESALRAKISSTAIRRALHEKAQARRDA